jgi:hypothetical protein
MKVIKSDGRYNFYNQGFTTIMEFNMRLRHEREEFVKLQKGIECMYGPHKFLELERNRWRMNEHYRIQLMSDKKRRRIYLKDEGTVSMLLLKVS